MSVEIHQPEIEALIQQRLASGSFQDVEQVLIYALKSAPPADVPTKVGIGPKETLEQMFAKAQGVLTDAEVDDLVRRDPSPGRPVVLS